jgi:transcriptional regulator with XRE-family HTH domain
VEARTRTHSGIGPTGERVGENLARVREYRRLTTAKLAEAVAAQGVPMNATTVTKIEKKDRRVTVDELVALAVVLGVSPTLLLLPIDPPEQEPSHPGSEHVAITEETSVPWETAWRWLHGQRPLHDASQRQNRDFWFTNRPYESDNPEDEAALVMSARVQGAWAPVSDRRPQEERSSAPHGWSEDDE